MNKHEKSIKQQKRQEIHGFLATRRILDEHDLLYIIVTFRHFYNIFLQKNGKFKRQEIHGFSATL